jgi:hypothetical protein
MVIAQTILILPIIAALCRQAVDDAWREYEEQLRSLGRAGAWRCAYGAVGHPLLPPHRGPRGPGRASAEVGAVMIVGGNIDGVTRVMTTTIALETSKGDSAAGARPGHRADRHRPRAQRRRLPGEGGGAAPLRMILPSAGAPFAYRGIIEPLTLELEAGPQHRHPRRQRRREERAHAPDARPARSHRGKISWSGEIRGATRRWCSSGR